jgi:hypothetical protein
MRELATEFGFKLSIKGTEMGGQEVSYENLILAGVTAGSSMKMAPSGEMLSTV